MINRKNNKLELLLISCAKGVFGNLGSMVTFIFKRKKRNGKKRKPQCHNICTIIALSLLYSCAYCIKYKKSFPKEKGNTVEIQLTNMEGALLPRMPKFLDSVEKYNDCIRNTKTLSDFEKVVYEILDDPEVSLSEFYRIIKCVQRDVYLVHHNKEINSLVDAIESALLYMIERRATQYDSDIKE